MIRIMKYSDLAQCGVIYAKAFPIEHWGIDWTAENATDYLQDFFEQIICQFKRNNLCEWH